VRPLTGRTRPEGADLVTSPLSATSADSGTWVFASFYDNGFFVRTAEGRSVNTTKADYPAAAADSATHNMKFAKALLRVGSGASRGFDRVIGHRLELVPRADPFAVTSGGQLALEVRFEGKPLAGASVVIYGDMAADATEPTTSKHVADAQGMVRVPVTRRGPQLVSVEHGVPSRHPDLATRDVYAASLVFTLP
jgi:nickel transport protein